MLRILIAKLWCIKNQLKGHSFRIGLMKLIRLISYININGANSDGNSFLLLLLLLLFYIVFIYRHGFIFICRLENPIPAASAFHIKETRKKEKKVIVIWSILLNKRVFFLLFDIFGFFIYSTIPKYRFSVDHDDLKYLINSIKLNACVDLFFMPWRMENN